MDKHFKHAVISITEGSIPKALLSFFFPIFLGSLFQQLYNTVDAIIVGRFVGTNALAAVGGGVSVYVNLLVGLFVGISNGASVIISQRYGAKDKKGTHDAIETSMTLSGIGGILVMVIGLVFADWGLRIISTPQEIMELSKTYLTIYFAGMIPMFVYNMGSSVLRSMGDSKQPLYILVLGCFVNIFADLFFVLALHMGVAGVAWATVLSQVVCAILIILIMRKNEVEEYRFRFHDLQIRKDLLKRMLAIGVPSGIQSCMYNIGNLLIQGAINSLGTVFIAANAAFGKIDAFFWMCSNSFGVSMTVFSGQNYGADKIDRMKKGTWICLGLCTIMTAICTTAFLLWGRQILTLFTTDPEVLEQGMAITRVIAPSYITFISVEVLSGAIRGCGQTLIPTFFTVFGICALRVLWIAIVFPLYPSIQTIMIAYPISWIVTSVMFWIYYCKGHWLKRDPKF